MNNIAFILARSKSKRIKNKNIIKINGKHLIGWLILKLKRSNFFREIIVSTDSIKIKKISEHYGARVPFLRSKLNASDHATTNSALLETITKYNKINRAKYKYACCFYASNPFFEMNKNIAGFKKIKKNKYHSVFSSLKINNKYVRSFTLNKQNKISLLNKNFLNSRTQDLPKAYLDAGQWYWIDTGSYINEKKIITNNSSTIIIDDKKSIDLDTLMDLKKLKKIFNGNYGKK